MDDFLFAATHLVKQVDDVLLSIKDNVARMQAILGQWQHDLMFERKVGEVEGGQDDGLMGWVCGWWW